MRCTITSNLLHCVCVCVNTDRATMIGSCSTVLEHKRRITLWLATRCMFHSLSRVQFSLAAKKSDVQSERCGLPGRRGIFPYCQASTDVFHFSRWRKEKKEGLLTEPCAQITHPTITPHNVQRQQKRRLERRSVEKAANVSNGTESKTREFSVEERLNGFDWEIARRSNFLQWHIRLILP